MGSFSKLLVADASKSVIKRTRMLSTDNDCESDYEDVAEPDARRSADVRPKFLGSYLRRVAWIECQRFETSFIHASAAERVQQELKRASDRRSNFSRQRKEETKK
jgi:hypothetical protein